MGLRKSAGALAACAAIAAVGASAASAKTTTYHFFSKGVYSAAYDVNGRPLSENAPPSVGAQFVSADDDYVGDHTHHARTATASDHLVCTIGSNPMLGRCDGVIAIGGALVIADNFTIDFSSNDPLSIKITGGTGRFRHAHGTIVSRNVGNNSDLTVTLR